MSFTEWQSRQLFPLEQVVITFDHQEPFADGVKETGI
jgi:hypothetical protein